VLLGSLILAEDLTVHEGRESDMVRKDGSGFELEGVPPYLSSCPVP